MKDIKLVCPKCESDNVQSQGWFDPNTNLLIDEICADSYCSDCEEHFSPSSFKEIIKENN